MSWLLDVSVTDRLHLEAKGLAGMLRISGPDSDAVEPKRTRAERLGS
jgi:hypothetical protein